MSTTINPTDDGVGHINIWSKAATPLGRELTNLAPIPLDYGLYGPFACLEGVWWWLKTGNLHDEFRMLDGHAARALGKTLPVVENPDFQAHFLEAIRCRLRQTPRLMQALRDSDLPFLHYYAYGEGATAKVVDRTERHQWQLDEYVRIRALLKAQYDGIAKVLQLAVKTEYFAAMASGEKVFEFRGRNEYWQKRLVDRTYDTLVITQGYPPREDLTRRIEVPYLGYEEQTITHPHFGDQPVEVYAIRVDISQRK